MMKVFILRINKNNIEQYSSYYVCSNKKQALNLFKKIYDTSVGCLLSSTLNVAAKSLLEQDKIEDCINLINAYSKDSGTVSDLAGSYNTIPTTYITYAPNTSGSGTYVYPGGHCPPSSSMYHNTISSVSYDQCKFQISIIESDLKGNAFDSE